MCTNMTKKKLTKQMKNKKVTFVCSLTKSESSIHFSNCGSFIVLNSTSCKTTHRVPIDSETVCNSAIYSLPVELQPKVCIDQINSTFPLPLFEALLPLTSLLLKARRAFWILWFKWLVLIFVPTKLLFSTKFIFPVPLFLEAKCFSCRLPFLSKCLFSLSGLLPSFSLWLFPWFVSMLSCGPFPFRGFELFRGWTRSQLPFLGPWKHIWTKRHFVK